MTPENATAAAKAILEKRAGENEIRVLVDSPKDSVATISAFRKLGCKVKVEKDGARLVVTRPRA